MVADVPHGAASTSDNLTDMHSTVAKRDTRVKFPAITPGFWTGYSLSAASASRNGPV
jgi:hypothetical protein